METTATTTDTDRLLVVRTRTGNATHLQRVTADGRSSVQTLCGCRAAGRLGPEFPAGTRENVQAARAAVTCDRC